MKFKRQHLNEAIYVARNRKTLTAMLKDVFKGKFKMSFYTYIVAVLTIIYAISPVDLLPDFIPVLGWVDDGILLILLFQQLRKELARYRLRPVTQNAEAIIIK